jgi:hypothetical protein
MSYYQVSSSYSDVQYMIDHIVRSHEIEQFLQQSDEEKKRERLEEAKREEEYDTLRNLQQFQDEKD